MLRSAVPRCLVLAGCTGIGKSALAVRLALEHGGEIVSADSVAVYRHLNVGADKPPRQWRDAVPHHLVDAADPAQPTYTAAQFADDATGAIHAIHSRGNLPIVVGGSGMYLSFLIHGFDRSQSSSARCDTVSIGMVEAAVSGSQSWDDAISVLGGALSPGLASTARQVADYLKHIQPGNVRRLESAVHRLRCLAPGSAVPEYNGRQVYDGTPKGNGDQIDFRCVFLQCPRTTMYRAIDLRCERMLQNGLLDEVSYLLERGWLVEGTPPANSIGYRQAIEFLREPKFDLAAFRLFVDEFQAASRQFARKQVSWFRRDFEYRFIDVDRKADPEDDRLSAMLMDWYRLDRDQLDAVRASSEYQLAQKALRQTLTKDARDEQRKYLPERVIFKHGLSLDAIMRLMAQSQPSPDFAPPKFVPPDNVDDSAQSEAAASNLYCSRT
ncbi:tRNA dimethylallyltransferase [Plasmodiophora brassicae]|nr:hypothetical protein PBRA_004561 [Plasmodiophora brassicae]